MKGAIAVCLRDMVCEKFGEDKWNAALATSGIPVTTKFQPFQDIPDEVVMSMVSASCKVLNVTPEQAISTWADYWVSIYAPKHYAKYYKGRTNARDFLLKMDEVHEATTNIVANAKPPRFSYEQPDSKTLIMSYKSHRGLFSFFEALVLAVGRHYKEDLQVQRLDDNKLKITFDKKR